MYKIIPSTQFKKDSKKLSKSGTFDMNLLKEVIVKLGKGKELDPMVNRPHSLKGNWKGFSECHIGSISSDWILIYKIDNTAKVLKLARTGTHSEIFG